MVITQNARFASGRVVATPGALAALEASNSDPRAFLDRHFAMEQGALDDEDHAANARALVDGTRIFSAYHLDDGEKIWIITEHDRSATTILLPEEY